MSVPQVIRVWHEVVRQPREFLALSRVVVEVSGRSGVRWFRLANPTRLVLDLQPARAAVSGGNLPVANPPVLAVRWASHPGDRVRVVLDLSRQAAFRLGWLDGPPRLTVDVDRSEVAVYRHDEARLEVLPFDEYLTGVLAAEMPPGFQGEALKAQAVASRTYALRRHRGFGGPGCTRHPGADLCDDPTHCQGYRSPESLRAEWGEDFERRWTALASAVDATRHLFLTYGAAVADAVFHSTCGGHTAAAEELWGTQVPYLAGVPCEYCQISPHYRRTVRFDLAEAGRRLKLDFASVRRRTPSGRAAEVVLAGRSVGGGDASMNLELGSSLVEALGGELVVTVRGRGHGVGLCQWGAEGQARLGRTFREILRYYYPGAVLSGVAFPSLPGGIDDGGPGAEPAPLPVVVLDPGHGGADPGATGPGGSAEKHVNLAVALAASEALSGRTELHLTRRDDRTVPLGERAELASATRAALFVSVHANGSVDQRATGTETYHYPTSTLGATLAGFIQRRLVEALGRRDRGVKPGDYFVLRETPCPAALVEVLFITNPEEERLLASGQVQRRAGEAIAAGILDYLARVR